MDRKHSKFCAVVVALSAAFSFMPLLQPYFFASSDGLFHLYRLMEYDLLLKSGVWLPRWAPDFNFGSGMPLFNFYAPLTYYLAEIFRLFGAGYVDSLRLFVAAMMVLSGLGAFLYSRTLFSPLTSSLVAVVYMYAPYHLVNLYYRGDVAEYAAFTWFPFILWTTTKLIRRQSYAYLLVGAIFYGMLILTHNLSAFIFSGFLAIYAIGTLVEKHLAGGLHWRALQNDALRLLAMVASALTLTAFFWLPAAVEKSQLSFERLLAAFDFREHFPTMGELVSTDLIHRYGVVFRSAEVYGYRLGLLQTAFLVAGLILLIWQRRRLGLGTKAQAIVSLAVTAVSLFFIFPVSQGIWETIPMLDLTQFSWRFLAFIALPSAFLAGLLIELLSDRLRTLAVLVIAPAVVASSVAAMFPIMSHISEAQVTPQGSMVFEMMTGAVGTTAAAEYLPRWVKEIAPNSPYALASALDESTAGSSRRSSSGVAAVQTERTGDRIGYRVNATSPGAFISDIVYFPGWIARIDGRQVISFIDEPSGLIKLEVPAGEHVVGLEFQSTPLRSLADAVSLATLVALAIPAIWRRRRSLASGSPAIRLSRLAAGSDSEAKAGGQGRDGMMRIAGVRITREHLAKALILVALASVWLVAKSSYDSTYAAAPSFGSPLVANLDGQVMIDGYALSGQDGKLDPATQIAPGSTLKTTVFWHKLDGGRGNDYRPFVRLTNRFDRTWAFAAAFDERPDAGPGRPDIMATTFEMAVPAGVPPGIYEIEVAFESAATNKLLEVKRVWVVPVLPAHSGVRIGPVVVGRDKSHLAGEVPPAAIQGKPYLASPVSFGDDLRLLDLSVVSGEATKSGKPGVALSREAGSDSWQLRAGEAVHIDLLWHTLRKLSSNLTVTARLVGADRSFWAIRDSQPADGTYPTTYWASGERVRDQLDILVPPETPPGQYELQLEVVSPTGPLSIIGNNRAPIGPTLRIGSLSLLPAAVPARLKDLKVQKHAEIQVIDGLDLVGYSLSRPEMRPGESLTADLIWRATKAIAADLVASVELVDPAGNTLASDKRRPAGNAYPTTAWRPGEFLRGKHTFTLPPGAPEGEAGLRVTLNNAGGGEPLGHVGIGKVRILPRTRIFSATPSRPLGVDFEDRARLLGYDLAGDAGLGGGETPRLAPSSLLTVTLYWQDIREMQTGYTVFVQVLNSAGRLVAQNDSPPKGGEAPTTAWVRGEVVIDDHHIAIPAELPDGIYTIIAGLYDATTGKRLSLEGGDYIALTRLLVSSRG
ncbi:MAG: hypothetical protein HYX94_06240 [Chloroflexi bacterium]|nr:hypothetical protein [Chloroflexota bacterium]